MAGDRMAKKKYRLVRGKHRYPNPHYVEGKSDPSESHVTLQPGEVCELNDDQFKAFKDRFVPIEVGATDVRDADLAMLELAKERALLTGEMQDPNKPQTTPLPPQIGKSAA